MGILNVTDDSFSDGGLFVDLESAKHQAEQMITAGAQIIDIGGESTRPGAEPISEQQELDRVIPVIEYLSAAIDVSIDTSKANVMTEAVNVGAAMINDVCALKMSGALSAAASAGVPVCLMHMQGSPRTMQNNPSYNDLLLDVSQFFEDRISACEQAGIPHESIILDPGFGFGKTAIHNVKLLRNLSVFKKFGLPILAGLSRKSLIAEVIDKPAHERVIPSVALAILAWQNGASILRVHDVTETAEALRMCHYIKTFQGEG